MWQRARIWVVCGLTHLGVPASQVLRCSKIASVKVSEITELIQKALENDKKAR